MRVGASGGGEICVPFERREILFGAIVIDGVEKKFFLAGGNGLRKNSRGKKKYK